MKLLRMGSVGVNVSNITNWKLSYKPIANKQNSSDETIDTLDVTFVGGGTESFKGEEASVLGRWLQRNAANIMSPSRDVIDISTINDYDI